MMEKPGFVLAGVLLLSVVASCGEGAPSQTTPTAPAGETPEATPPASPTPAVTATLAPSPTPSATPSSPAFEGTRGPLEKEGAPPTALLVDVTTGLHEVFDRVVFEFEEGTPGYRIEYVEPPITGEFSGLPVEITGNAFLRVSFRGAAGFDPFTGEPTYDGPLEIAIGLPSLLEAERTGDFEGVLTWVVGLAAEVDFRVLTLEEPFRVAIDVAHGEE